MNACDSPSYRPHLVVGDPERRFAIVDDGGRGEEAYLGVHFTGSGQPLPPGVEHTVELSLVYPGVDYSALVAGARFTIQEGGKIVGFGRVLH